MGCCGVTCPVGGGQPDLQPEGSGGCWIHFSLRFVHFWILTPHGSLVFLLLLVVVAVDDHGPQVGLQHGAAVFNHGLRAITHGAGGPHGSCTFWARLDHRVRVHLGLLLLDDTRRSVKQSLRATDLWGYVRSCRLPPPAPSAAPAASWPSSPWPQWSDLSGLWLVWPGWWRGADRSQEQNADTLSNKREAG